MVVCKGVEAASEAVNTKASIDVFHLMMIGWQFPAPKTRGV